MIDIDQDSLPTGSLDEVEQAEEAPFVPLTIPVQVENVVPVHITGSKHGVSFNRQMLSVDGPKRLLAVNPRRRVVRLLCDQQFYYNVQQAGLLAGATARWNANLPLEITHKEEIWAYLPIDGTMNVISEDWAD